MSVAVVGSCSAKPNVAHSLPMLNCDPVQQHCCQPHLLTWLGSAENKLQKNGLTCALVVIASALHQT